MKRPPVGSRWTSPESGTQVYRIATPEKDRYAGLVAAVTERGYTTRDIFGYPVGHKPGEATYLRQEDFGTRLLAADDKTYHWLVKEGKDV